MNRFKGWGILVAVALCVLVVAITQKPIRIAYHKREMRKIMNAPHQLDVTSTDVDELLAELDRQVKFRSHRRELVHLGNLIQKEYIFNHVSGRTPEGRHFSSLILLKRCPPFSDTDGDLYSSRQLQLIVWTEPKHIEEWIHFISEHDIADYAEKFMDVNDRKKYSVETALEREMDRLIEFHRK